jgi:hypothetical protein
MNSPLTDEQRSGAASNPAPRPANAQHRRRPWTILASAAAAAVIIVGAVAVIGGGDSNSDGPGVAAGPPLELSLGAGDALASCMAFDVTLLAGMSPAFAATATAIDGETVTLTVDRWYTGGDAATVVLQAPAGQEALTGGVAFEVGGQYLITAAEGVVNSCGYSGPATPELTAAFEQAFGA